MKVLNIQDTSGAYVRQSLAEPHNMRMQQVLAINPTRLGCNGFDSVPVLTKVIR